jgi:hypothetical protein
MKNKKRLHDVEAVNSSDEGEGDCTKSGSSDAGDPPKQPRKHSHQSNAQIRVSDAEQYEKFRAEVNSVDTAYLKDCYPDLYRVYRTLEEFEKDEVRQYLRTYLFQREDDIGKLWAWVYWRTRDQRLNWSDFAYLIGVNRVEITRKIRPQAIQAYAQALVQALKFYHHSTS